MQKTVNFKKKIIVSAIASAIGFSGAAFAQDDAEEIVITGIKASLTRAMDIKRDAAGVVDAISAEDIGKMPDANLAESLQRISGVSISRAGGEGSRVTVRGLASDYNLVTLNGRQMPASTTSGDNLNTSRSFDFGNLASEGVSGVEVYKTGRADIATGGMGALINILTPHPLNNPGLKSSIGIKATLDESSKDANVTPEISGLYSNTFADDTFGVALTGSYQEREFGSAQAFSAGWFNGKGTQGDGGNFQGDWGSVGQAWAGNVAYAPQSTTQVYTNPINFGYRVWDQKRTRINGNLALQYKPVETLTVGLDYTVVSQEAESRANSISTWFNRGTSAPLNIKWTDNKTGAIAPLYYEETNANPTDLAMDAQFQKTKNELNSLGLNVKFDVTDNFTIKLDAHNSVSDSKPNGIYGTGNSLTVQSRTNYNPSIDFSKEIPILHLDYPTSVGTAPTAAQMQLTGSTFRNVRQKSEVDQYQLAATYSFDEGILKAIDFGAAQTEIGNRSQYVVTDLQNHGSWGGVGQPGDFEASLWPTDKLTNYFDNSAMKDPSLQNTFMVFDLEKVAKAAGAKVYVPAVIGNGTAQNPQFPATGYSWATVTPNSPCAMAYCAPTVYANIQGQGGWGGQGTTDLQTVETSDSAYFMTKFETEIAGMTTHLVAGARAEETSVESTSRLPVNGNAYWNAANEFTVAITGNDEFVKEEGHYHRLLPSLDFDIGLTESIKVRASASRTLARANYSDLQAGFRVTGVRVGGGTATSGNPNLKPLLSTNSDLSVEWYYDDASYVSAGYFIKDLKDFIGTAQRTLGSTIKTPVGGSRYNAAVAAVGTDNALVRQYIFDHSPAGDTYVQGNNIYAMPSDPTVVLSATYPVNNKEAKVDGFEAAVQHTFGESGFGVVANYTAVDSDLTYDNNSLAEQFAVLGLSDSYNLVAFYDKNGIQARIAYNWRDEFLSYVDGTEGTRNPVYVEAYGQVDASVSYSITENLTVSLEGSNLTNEHSRSHGRAWQQLFNYTETGARYNLGARYKF